MTAAPPAGHLSRQQTRALTLVAHGLSYAQVAKRMSIHQGTVDNYLWKARTALGAATTGHAIALAIAGGHLSADVAAGTAVTR